MTDPYELTIASILKNNSFYKDPTLVIAKDGQILSTNDPAIEELGAARCEEVAAGVQWKSDELTEFRYQDTTYYGLHRVYGIYDIYAVYASGNVFTHRTAYVSFVFMLYLAVGVAILAFQRRSDRTSINKMEKQLRIINAISTVYDSAFLLHVDSMELEPIRPSTRLSACARSRARACRSTRRSKSPTRRCTGTRRRAGRSADRCGRLWACSPRAPLDRSRGAPAEVCNQGFSATCPCSRRAAGCRSQGSRK